MHQRTSALAVTFKLFIVVRGSTAAVLLRDCSNHAGHWQEVAAARSRFGKFQSDLVPARGLHSGSLFTEQKLCELFSVNPKKIGRDPEKVEKKADTHHDPASPPAAATASESAASESDSESSASSSSSGTSRRSLLVVHRCCPCDRLSPSSRWLCVLALPLQRMIMFDSETRTMPGTTRREVVMKVLLVQALLARAFKLTLLPVTTTSPRRLGSRRMAATSA